MNNYLDIPVNLQIKSTIYHKKDNKQVQILD